MRRPPEPGAWRRSSPFAVVFFLGATIRSIAGSSMQLVASVGTLAYLSRLDVASGQGGALAGAVLLGLTVVAVLRYWFFRFRLEEDRVLIRQGVVKRTELDLPFARLQRINVERSLIDRALGLVTIHLDTAGSASSEGRLPAVSTELADWLRARHSDAPGRAAPAEQAARPASHPATVATSTHPPILRLRVADMVRIGVADRTVLILMGALGALYEAVEPALNRVFAAVEPAFEAVASRGPVALGGAVAASVVLGVAFFLSLSVASALLRHHDYTLWRRGGAYRSRSGLLTQKEVTVEIPKIQQLTLYQGLVMRVLRRCRLVALPAGGLPVPDGAVPANARVASNLVVPLLDGGLAERLRVEITGAESEGLSLLPFDPRFRRVSKHYVRALALRTGLVAPAVAAVPVLVALTLALGLSRAAQLLLFLLPWLAGWVALALGVAWLIWRRCGYLAGTDGLAVRKGMLGARVEVFLARKAQFAMVSQSPMQRRRRLATLHVGLASGAVTLPWIPLDEANALRDWILYKAESARLRWH